MATRKEIAAVRKVLYERKRVRRMLVEVQSIDVLMNLNPRATLEPDDSRVVAGSGPNWTLEDGSVNSGVLEAADRCERLAALLREARDEIADVEFDREDKRNLREALEQQAKAWVARGRIWRAPAKPNVGLEVAEISRHEKAALSSYQRVDKYLHDPHVKVNS